MSGTEIEHGGAAESPLPKETEEQAAERLQWEADQADEIAKDRGRMAKYRHITNNVDGLYVASWDDGSITVGTGYLMGVGLTLHKDMVQAIADLLARRSRL